MKLENKNIVITGGCGFIGSHLAEKLTINNHVKVIDNLNSGKKEYIPEKAKFENIDLLDRDKLKKGLNKEIDIIFHLAANPDIRKGTKNIRLDLKQNTIATNNLLEIMKKYNIKNIAFTSTSTVYGENVPIPTSESFGPLKPISLYGASKLACEGLCTAFEGTFGFRSWIFRFANIVGRRCHGIIPDFIEKLLENPNKLEILGDGNQKKSYLHIADCIQAIISIVENGEQTIYNIGSGDTISVTEIAEIVSKEMGLNPRFEYTGGKRGWKGDVTKMLLSIEKIKSTGWNPQNNSKESIQKATQEMLLNKN